MKEVIGGWRMDGKTVDSVDGWVRLIITIDGTMDRCCYYPPISDSVLRKFPFSFHHLQPLGSRDHRVPRSVAKAMGDPADAAAGSLGAGNSFVASFGCTVKAMGNMRKQINSWYGLMHDLHDNSWFLHTAYLCTEHLKTFSIILHYLSASSLGVSGEEYTVMICNGSHPWPMCLAWKDCKFVVTVREHGLYENVFFEHEARNMNSCQS